MFKKDIFGQYVFLKKLVIRVFGFITYSRFAKKNSYKIKGAEIIQNLPNKNVLFVSNHQTYFGDGAFIFHVIHSALDGYPNEINRGSVVKCLKSNLFFVGAEETLDAGILPKLLGLAGAIRVKRI